VAFAASISCVPAPMPIRSGRVYRRRISSPRRARKETIPLLSSATVTSHSLDEGTVRAVEGVSFEVRPGQVVGIVGESGCGKSVTMRAILQLIEHPGWITGGEILYRRSAAPPPVIDLARLPPRGRLMRVLRGAEIALIPQEPIAGRSRARPTDLPATIKLRRGLLLGGDVPSSASEAASDSAVELTAASPSSTAVSKPGWCCPDWPSRTAARDVIRPSSRRLRGGARGLRSLLPAAPDRSRSGSGSDPVD
jgi:hypothetical protein